MKLAEYLHNSHSQTMKSICRYEFPCHPEYMFKQSDPYLRQSARTLRVQAIEMIANLSQQFSQSELDNKVYADVLDGEILGFDLSELVGFPDMKALCVGNSRVKLGSLSASNWCTMRV